MSTLVQEADAGSWNVDVLGHDGLVLVVFFATWCESSQRILSELTPLAQTYGESVRVFTLDVDACAEIAMRYRISIAPTAVFFRRGQKLHEIICASDPQKITTSIDALQE